MSVLSGTKKEISIFRDENLDLIDFPDLNKALEEVQKQISWCNKQVLVR